MKYLIVLASGMADEPLEELGGRTPLEAAHTPALDELARDGKTGCVRALPEGLPASGEAALRARMAGDQMLSYVRRKSFRGMAHGLQIARSVEPLSRG